MEMTQKSYRELQAELDALTAKIEAAREEEAATALAEIQETIRAFGFSVKDVFGRQAGKTVAAASNRKYPPKYRNPNTNETWSGMGRAPAWILESDDRDQFLIKP
ncbi:H-NS histone family protein [Burkholderia multivorans]|uniref:H-NS histone family protein n=1 Tax=Burkholderia multivorans TaxID=87883 RepID=UPI001C21EC8A|nr:H-NS histone family protein [Burkholderia multivorans]MBU9199905.1 H-NS histone family protein [Burkholderia multivorans]MDN8078976.1 H-NS histone family protein [Burkholderia multivorans]